MPDQRHEEQSSEPQWIEDGLCVGEWYVEPQRNSISWHGPEGQAPEGEAHVRLEPKVVQVLVCLARRPGKTVTKAAFMEEVWPGTVVSNDALLRCISELRSALGDDARDPDYIETIRKVGYRLIAPVSYSQPAVGSSSLEPPSPVNEASSSIAGSFPAEEQQHLPALPGSADPEAGAPAGIEVQRRGELGNIPRGGTSGGWPRWAVAIALLVLLGASLFAVRGWFVPGAPAPSQVVPFTSFPGEEFDSALSPDGEQVAFVWNEGTVDSSTDAEARHFDIYIKQRGATGKPLRITETPAREYSPAWSPEGSRLAFLRQGEEETQLVVAPVIGGGEQTVAHFGRRAVKGVVWSPQGDTLALSVQRRPYGVFRLVLFTLKDRRRRVLTTPPDHYLGDVAPAFSPDGQTLAFARGVVDRVQDLYTIPVGGGTPTRLTRDRSSISGLDWTADGQSIIFASDRKGASRLWRVAAGGGAPSWVAMSGQGGLHQPSIAREGVRMTLTERSLDMNIWRLHPVAGYDRLTSHRLLSSTRWESYPDVAPDGERLAFASKRSGSFEIWTAQRDGTDPVQLTNFSGPFVSAPRWSPAGDHIAFSVQGEKGADVYVVDDGGTEARRLTHQAASDVVPRWSRDGRWIYFASNRSGRWQIWKQPAEGGGPAQQVTEDGGFAAEESPDGAYLYYVKRDERGLWRRPLTRDSVGNGVLALLKNTLTKAGLDGEERVNETLEPYDWGNWAVTERGLYYVSRTHNRPGLMYQRTLEDAPLRMAYLDGLPRHPGLAVAPGGRWFLHAKVEHNESDILLVERFR